MKTKIIILSLVIIGSVSLACDGNCVSCHPVLIKAGTFDDNHKILKNCTNCHTPNGNDHGQCGNDCWSCHDIQEVSRIDIPEHRILPTCIECHQSVNKKLFDISDSKKFDGFSLSSQLK